MPDLSEVNDQNLSGGGSRGVPASGSGKGGHEPHTAGGNVTKGVSMGPGEKDPNGANPTTQGGLEGENESAIRR